MSNKILRVRTPLGETRSVAANVKAVFPHDPRREFAAAAQRHINGKLVRCEERYPNDAPHSVLYVVVERDTPQCRRRLHSLHKEWFGPARWNPLVPVRLEIIDRSTDETLERLIEAGILAQTTRAARPLWPTEPADGSASPPPLSTAELARISTYRQRAARKLKMAQVLLGAGLDEEARPALLQALLPLACALALEHRLPELESLNEVLLPPLSTHWKQALPLLRNFIRDSSQSCQPLLDALTPITADLPGVAAA